MMTLLKFLFSFIYPVTVERISSAINPVLEVRIENGKYVLNAANANYSYGSLHKIFLKIFQRINIGERNIKNVLLLGFGAGSVPQLLLEEFKIDCEITAVEIDEKVIELGKKYFNIQRFKNFKLMCDDAFKFVQKSAFKFDLIVVDLFIDNKVPSQFASGEFFLVLKKLMDRKGLLLYNIIVHPENDTQNLRENLKAVFGKFEILKVFENKIMMVSN